MARGYRRVLGVLAGVPSVVYGLWGLSVVVPLVRRLGPPGPSPLSASLVLALMVLPTLALFADAALARLPLATRQGAAALALSRPTFVLAVALPAARSGLAAATVLAISVHIYDLAMNVPGGSGAAHASAALLVVLLLIIEVATSRLGRFLRTNPGGASR